MKKIIFLLLFIPLFALPQSSGTGFAINSDGYIATNHHVIDGANNIIVTGIDGDMETTYHAKVIVEDKRNDLAILKIEKRLGEIPYKMNKSTLGKGNGVYALGYPLPSMLGRDINFTDGKISKTSGFDNDPTYYQHSAPIQPGNSGGPLFNEDGNIIGINTSGIDQDYVTTEGIFFSVKARYLINLIEEEGFSLPSGRGLDNYKIPQQVERIEKFIYSIIASNDNMNTNDIYKESPIFPSWDCSGIGNCYDPGTGKGQYLTQSTCESNCIAPSWDCIGTSCIDLGTGNGTYLSFTVCQLNCPKLEIVPSPSSSPSTNNSTSTKSSYTTSSNTSYYSYTPNILSYDYNNNCPFNIRYSAKMFAGETGFYIGLGYGQTGELGDLNTIYTVENGHLMQAGSGNLSGSFGPVIEGGESSFQYYIGAGVTRHIFYTFWWSVGLALEENYHFEKRERFFDGGDYWELTSFLNDDKYTYFIYPETDIYLKIFDVITVKYGISYKNATLNSVIGVGYNFW
jgi:hypothetical protein